MKRIAYRTKSYARIVLFRFTRGSGYTKSEAQDARTILGETEADRIVENAKKYKPKKFLVRAPGSYGNGRR